MNKVILIGRLTADPTFNDKNETHVAKYTLAVRRKFQKEGQPEADFFPCTAFGKAADFAVKYFKKGQQVAVDGRLEQNNYTNKNGEKVYGYNMMIENQEFADSKSKDDGSGSGPAASNPAPSAPDDNGFMSFDGFDDELPFN